MFSSDISRYVLNHKALVIHGSIDELLLCFGEIIC